MLWATGLFFFLAISQVPADLVKPDFIENVISAAPRSGQERILSGWPAYPGQIPYQTSLRMVNAAGGVSGCGGSVVAREWVITSAHCTAGQVTVVVRAGVTSLLTPVYMLETNEWYNHPTYNDNFPGIVQPNDISALKLQRPLTYSRLLQPIRIQPATEAFFNYDGEVVVASGFGRTWTDGPVSEELNWVFLRATSNAWCAQIYGSALINSNAICAQFYNVTSQSVCSGDSGGPLVHINEDGQPILIGVTSFVAGGELGCHSAHPAGFIRPGPFLGWLEQVTGIDFENLNEEEEVPSTPHPEEPTTTDAPEITTEAPNVTSTEPDVTTTAPNVTTTEPDVTTTAPNVTTTEPDVTTTAPNVTTTAPDVTTTAPNVTTTAPDVTTTAPNVTTTSPDVTTTAPNVTTTAPNVTTTAPNVTTTEPYEPTTITDIQTTPAPSTTVRPPHPTTPQPEEEDDDDDDDDDSSEEEDPELAELLKQLIVKVKVKVKINNKLKRKIKVKCVENL